AELLVVARVTELTGRRVPEALARLALLAGRAGIRARARCAFRHGHDRRLRRRAEIVERLDDDIDHTVRHARGQLHRVVRRVRLTALSEGRALHLGPLVAVEPELRALDAALRAGLERDDLAIGDRGAVLRQIDLHRGRRDHRLPGTEDAKDLRV